MIGHVPTLVLKEFLGSWVESDGNYVVPVYEGRCGGYEEAVSCFAVIKVTGRRLMDLKVS